MTAQVLRNYNDKIKELRQKSKEIVQDIIKNGYTYEKIQDRNMILTQIETLRSHRDKLGKSKAHLQNIKFYI